MAGGGPVCNSQQPRASDLPAHVTHHISATYCRGVSHAGKWCGVLCPVIGHNYRAGDVARLIGIVVAAVQSHRVGVIKVRRSPTGPVRYSGWALVSVGVMGWFLDGGFWRRGGGWPPPLPQASDRRTVAGDRVSAPRLPASRRRFLGRPAGSMPEPG